MHRSRYGALVACVLLAAGCEDGTGPGTGAESGIDFELDAAFERTDSTVVVDGEVLFPVPSIARSVREYRYLHYDFGGFPELGYELEDRAIDFRGLVLTNREPPVLRNDSTIYRFVDHGTVTADGLVFVQESTIPVVPAGERTAYENFVQYTLETFARIVWAGGDTTRLVHQPLHDDILAGAAVELTSSGSPLAHATLDSIRFEALATLTGMTNGEAVSFDVDAAPGLDVAEDLVLEFDNELDPERAFIRLVPFTAGTGTHSAFIQPRRATRRVVIPAAVLEELLGDAAAERHAYYILIEQYAIQPDAFSGTRPGAADFTLPLFQSSETALHVWLER